MGPGNQCLALMARLSISGASRPLAFASRPLFRPLAPAVVAQTRSAQKLSKAAVKKMKKAKRDKEEKRRQEKKQKQKEYKNPDPTEYPQFSLCDAIRYIRASEVGRPPSTVVYNAHIRVRASANGATIKSSVKLPHPVKNDFTFAFICPEDSDLAKQALEMGAVAVGQERLFQRIRDGEVEFDRLYCHESSELALKKSGLGRLLGPKGLMPTRKAGTVTGSLKKLLSSGAVLYREHVGVIEMPVGRVDYTPKQISENLQALVGSVKDSCARLSSTTKKELREVVLSSTKGPGFNLNGKFRPTDPTVRETDLTGPL